VPQACLAWVMAVAGLLLFASSARSEVTVAAYGDFSSPPYQYFDSAGLPAGFDVDVFEASARAAGFVPEFKQETEDFVASKMVRLGASPNELTDFTSTLPYATTTHSLYGSCDSLVRGIEDLRHTNTVIVSHNKGLQGYLEAHGFGDGLHRERSRNLTMPLCSDLLIFQAS